MMFFLYIIIRVTTKSFFNLFLEPFDIFGVTDALVLFQDIELTLTSIRLLSREKHKTIKEKTTFPLY